MVAALTEGTAPLTAVGELAAQQHRIIASDRRSLLPLATRCADQPLGAWFATLAEGESAALRTLPALAAACGLDRQAVATRPPLPDCQAYPGSQVRRCAQVPARGNAIGAVPTRGF
ncbi:hypothetical protein [Kitasatospora sp. NPDC058190]|uniref:hypothetical protein n=1 Tax=Kitasatospora sp. NPDC058190 TaxID=3346371 RepID=UPI0036DB37B5